ncbi:MAG TPA: hypothetical protein VIW02_06045, partial [Gammaproteobacteria bacterium]
MVLAPCDPDKRARRGAGAVARGLPIPRPGCILARNPDWRSHHPMKRLLVISALGEDRPGIVND